MKEIKKLSETELEIMEYMWASNIPVTHIELLDYFNNVKKRNWKPQTVTSYTIRLLEKGLLKFTQKGRSKHYEPAISYEEYERATAKNILDMLYDGSIGNFMVALSGGKKLPDEDVLELKKWLDNNLNED